MQVIIESDYHAMSRAAAQLVLGFVRRKPAAVLGLPTGDTALGFYRELADAHARGAADFSRVSIFSLDEYAGLARSHPSSFAFYMYSNLLSELDLPREAYDVPDGMARDLQAECRRYECEIASRGGLDLAVLGIGVNGHIGFNEPGTPFDAACHVAKLSRQTVKDNRHHFGKAGEVPARAVTMGLGTIMSARRIVLIASGPRKAKAVCELVRGHMDRRFPASVLHAHDDVTVIVDEAAAAELKRAGFSDYRRRDFTILDERTLPRGKRIAVVSPHPDDSAIGAGGTIALLSPHNEVTNLVMTSGHRAHVPGTTKRERVRLRREEALAEAKVLGMDLRFLNLGFYDAGRTGPKDEARLLREFARIDPDIVFMTPENDAHPTHRLSAEVALRALRAFVARKQRAVEVWRYESPWCMLAQGEFNAFVELSRAAMRRKLKAVRRHRSQIARTPFHLVAEALATMRAATVPEQMLSAFGGPAPRLARHAEVFAVSRLVHGQKLVETFSGVRGVYGGDLTEDVALRYARAFGTWLAARRGANPRVVVGRDTRPSGRPLMEAMIRGLESVGCHVHRVDVGTTPMIQFEVRNRCGDGGIVVTASHNEPDWNGFKFLRKDGGVLSPAQMEELIALARREEMSEQRRRLDHYSDYVCRALGAGEIERIREAGLKVVVDPNGGAMIVLIKRLFEDFNIETVELNMDAGVFRHKVEPTADALEHIGPIVRNTGADLGVAWDCDGDRVELVTASGALVSGHYVLAMLADAVLAGKVRHKAVVVSNATSGVVADVAMRRGARVFETDAGEANVVAMMDRVGAPVGGEGSCGGGILPPSRCRDGVLTLFKILGLMALRGKSLETIIRAYPAYFTMQRNVRLSEADIRTLMRRVREHYAGTPLKRFGGKNGGVKVQPATGAFLLFRPSRTERNVLRIIADSRGRAETRRLMDEAMRLVI